MKIHARRLKELREAVDAARLAAETADPFPLKDASFAVDAYQGHVRLTLTFHEDGRWWRSWQTLDPADIWAWSVEHPGRGVERWVDAKARSLVAEAVKPPNPQGSLEDIIRRLARIEARLDAIEARPCPLNAGTSNGVTP